MRYENKKESRVEDPSPDLVVPNKPGFYWAKWQICEDGTEDEEHFVATGKWVVVEVEQTFGMTDTGADLDVSVHGYAKYQSLENFIWHKPIKPLETPK